MTEKEYLSKIVDSIESELNGIESMIKIINSDIQSTYNWLNILKIEFNTIKEDKQ